MLHTGVSVLAAGLSGTVALMAGLQRPYWAMVAAIVPVVGPSTAGQLLRAGHRLARTLLGL